MALDINLIREQYPALERSVVFLDNPAGTQVPKHVIRRMVDYLENHNANHDGAFATSIESDAILDESHAAVADLLNAEHPEEIIFGPNMTSLTLHISRSIARTWNPGDEIVVTHMDHDANITPWILAAEDRGVKVRWVDFDVDTGLLDLASLGKALENKPRLLAMGYASNALGTINPVAEIVQMARQVGTLTYIDAVQYIPHGPADVQALECDFLVCSSYKFFGPHQGALYGRYELLDELMAYKVRPASNDSPGKFETGTQNHEGIAGVLGALEYLEWLGRTFGGDYHEKYANRFEGRRLELKKAMAAIRSYEFELSRALLDVLIETPGVTLYGPKDVRRLERRVPTFSFRLRGWHPRKLAEQLAGEDIYVWDGNYYALAVTERLGVESDGGMLRVGPVHYNTLEEIYTFAEALGNVALQ